MNEKERKKNRLRISLLFELDKVQMNLLQRAKKKVREIHLISNRIISTIVKINRSFLFLSLDPFFTFICPPDEKSNVYIRYIDLKKVYKARNVEMGSLQQKT